MQKEVENKQDYKTQVDALSSRINELLKPPAYNGLIFGHAGGGMAFYTKAETIKELENEQKEKSVTT